MGLGELFLLAVGLSMDAFAVSICKGLALGRVRFKQMLIVGLWFGGFQALMPMIGWICVHTLLQVFEWFEKLIPWIALFLLLYIGGKMLWEGLHPGDEEEGCSRRDGIGALMIQGVATSIDALSVGFTISGYNLLMAVVCALIIAVVTFIICMAGLEIGKRFGTKLSGKADILGGVILIGIGLEIFITSFI